MRFKLYKILFIGLFFTFGGTIKAEEICYFSNPIDYGKCFEKKSFLKRKPKYPLTTFSNGGDIKWINGNAANGPHGTLGAIFKIIDLSALNSKKLKITIGNKRTTFFGITGKTPFISEKKETIINPKDIILWKNETKGGNSTKYPFGFYEIVYLDNYGNKKEINFFTLTTSKMKFMNEFFTNLSGLKKGENREIDSVILNKINRNLKELEIIGSIIKIASTEKECLIAKQSKFPELTEKYVKVYKTINPLKSKLDLPLSTDLKPICN